MFLNEGNYMPELRFFPPGPLHKYPHLYGEDALCTDAFWRINPFGLKNVAYDVPVFGFFSYQRNQPLNLDRDWDYLASFKIDFVGFSDEDIYIFEVKHAGGPAAIGQLLVYSHLFRLHYSGGKDVNLVMISFKLKPVVEEVANNFGIQCIQPPPPPESRYFEPYLGEWDSQEEPGG